MLFCSFRGLILTSLGKRNEILNSAGLSMDLCVVLNIYTSLHADV